MSILIFLLLLLPSLANLGLNIAMINKLNPHLNYHLDPSSISMGFFSTSDVSAMQSRTYTQSSTFSFQIIGSLSDIIYSSYKILAYQTCSNSARGGKTCTNYYWRLFKAHITCNSTTNVFYTDCISSGATYLTVVLKYLFVILKV